MKLFVVARSLATVVVMLGVAASAASAQDEKTVGLTMAYPAAVGLHWQITNRFAIRPDVTYGWSSTESTPRTSQIEHQYSGGVTEIIRSLPVFDFPSSAARTTSHSVGIGVGAFVTVHRKDALRLYLGPRFSFSRSTTTTTRDDILSRLPPEFLTILGGVLDRTTKSSNTSYAAAALFGAQYALSDRFALLVETGAAYSWSDPGDGRGFSLDSRRRNITHRSSIGAILFF